MDRNSYAAIRDVELLGRINAAVDKRVMATRSRIRLVRRLLDGSVVAFLSWLELKRADAHAKREARK